MRTLPNALAFTLTVVCTATAQGQNLVPVGSELEINTYNAFLFSPAISGLADGGFVVVWESSRSSGSDNLANSIQGRHYDADGTAVGEQFQINSYTTGHQEEPSVAALSNGGFVVTWSTGGEMSIASQRYDAAGSAQGEEFWVDSHTLERQSYPSVAASDDGGFIVVWQNSRSDPFERSIRGQVFDATGIPGEQFQVNTGTSDIVYRPSVAPLADGRFIAVWRDGTDFSGRIKGRILAADGQALSGELPVDSGTQTPLFSPSAAALADGGFVVAWDATDTVAPLGRVLGRRYSVSGAPLGPEFQVNSYTEGYQWMASVTATSPRWQAGGTGDGDGFAIVWSGERPSDSDHSLEIQSQSYGPDGQPMGGQFQVNTATANSQLEPAVTNLADGDLVVAWTSGGFGFFPRIRGQRYTQPRYALASLGGGCLDVEGSNPDDGTPVNLYRCHGGENQTWRLTLTSFPQRVVGLDGKCLLPGPVDATGVPRAVIGECGAGDLWRMSRPGHAEPSLLIHDDTGLCLDALGGIDGAPTRLVECHGGADQLWRPAAEVCTQDYFGSCLNQERFRIDLEWRSFDGTTGSGKVVPRVSSGDSGLLWFFEDDNWEMLIKVLDGCHLNDRLWVFAAATTTVEYTLRVTDTATGVIRGYFNPLGKAAAAITDTNAFDACSASTAAAEQPSIEPLLHRRQTEPPRIRSAEGACVPSPTRMCLSDGRFSVDVAWRDYADNTGTGQVIDTGSASGADDTSGLFWFFYDNNWEMLVKVLDACDLNGQFLFLGAATTDVEYTLTVTDTDTGTTWQHTNPLGQPSEALVHWFETCP